MADTFTYRRTALAASYCDALEGRGILDATSGLFLAAPRRTGKSTFLREDMVPEMRARGWQTLYVDLWSDRSRDPAELIIAVVRDTLAQLDQPGVASLADGLEQLHTLIGKPLVLLVDDALHALSTKAGTEALFALRSARDRLNQGRAVRGLHLVMTGSNRDKLTHLVLRRSEPFYGAGVTRFPLLDRGFVEAYAEWLRPQFADGKAFSADTLERAFTLVGRRPEMLKRVVGEAVADWGGAQALDALIERNAQEIQHRAWQEFASTYNALPDAQKAVLDAIARLSPDYTPFAEAALAAYQAVVGKPLNNSAIQGALDALRDKELIWRAGRGDYAFEDDGLRAWYLEQHPQPKLLGT